MLRILRSSVSAVPWRPRRRWPVLLVAVAAAASTVLLAVLSLSGWTLRAAPAPGPLASAEQDAGWGIDAHCHVSAAMHAPFARVMNQTRVRFAISHGTWRGLAYDLALVSDARAHYADRYAAFYAPTWGSSDPDYFKGTAAQPAVVVTDAYLATTLPDDVRMFIAAGGANALGIKLWRDVGTPRLVDSTGARLRLVDTRLAPTLDVVRRHGLVVSIHPCGRPQCRADLAAFLARHRGGGGGGGAAALKITLAHWAGLSANLTALASLLRANPDVLLDASPAPSWPTAPAADVAAFVRAFQDRIAFGTDFVEMQRTACCNDAWWACWYGGFRQYYETNATVALPCVRRWDGVRGIQIDDATVLHKLYWANAYRFYGLHRLVRA